MEAGGLGRNLLLTNRPNGPNASYRPSGEGRCYDRSSVSDERTPQTPAPSELELLRAEVRAGFAEMRAGFADAASAIEKRA